ncbi:capsule assembly Wzi family protein [Vibrio astriarenae]|uniref:Capsule assembly Wzi family protein n=1 Tax=Vibrio astriarenae TaxID=1481923 RepID=A0A7Z2T544_9VIBR|nr:capsule assembly Wzi family protein [Vibrio astriarenae]QIA64421.1 capsule assembly Wzi family protein [Vibrio astriarenae]
MYNTPTSMESPMRTFAKGLALSTLVVASLSHAKPWIEPNDLHLRADLQLLANAGIINVPITTYPLMWDGVINDVNKNAHQAKSGVAVDAVRRVKRAFQASQQASVKLEAGVASEASRFQHFGTPMREQAEVTAGYSTQGSWWAYNLEATYAYDAQDDEDVRLDGSYIAAIMGNWVLSAGYQQQWYGPGWDTALTMSTNARPLPSVNLTRHNPEAFDVPVLEWLGPWTLTTGIGWMNDERFMEDTLLWTFRGTIKPHPNFEFGVSRTAQLCGGNQKCNANTWWKMLIGDTNNKYEDAGEVNQLAAVDARWGDTAYGIPYSLYWESMGEDGVRLDRFPPFQAKSYLYGADITYDALGNSITSFIEYSETNPTCGTRGGNCAYEHHNYRSGYRYYNRVLGSTYDNDANTYTLGFIGFSHATTHRWKANLRYLELNKNGDNNWVEDGGGNKVSPNGENTWNIDFSYLFPIRRGEIELGTEYSFIENRDGTDESNIAVWAHWSYQF